MNQQGFFNFKYQSFWRKIITKEKEFTSLFNAEEFDTLKGITFGTSLNLVFKLLNYNFKSIELIIGDKVYAECLKELRELSGEQESDRQIEKIEDIFNNYIKEEKLRLFLPKHHRTIHTKLYILSKNDTYRIIMGSANLTETADLGRQVNYVWILDLNSEDNHLMEILKDYDYHKSLCSLFLGDLIDLVKQKSNEPQKEIIKVWFKNTYADMIDESEMFDGIKILQNISTQTLTQPLEEPIIKISLSNSHINNKKIKSILKKFDQDIKFTENNDVVINKANFLKTIQERIRPYPIMQLQEKNLIMNENNIKKVINNPLPASNNYIAKALENLEKYFNTVEIGESLIRAKVKANMFEALIYIFTAPFVNEYLKLSRRYFSAIGSSNVRMLYIFGDSRNGKTTFFKYAIKLLSNICIKEPLKGDDFKKDKILNIIGFNTVFPLIFDDVHGINQKEWLKLYWEKWWTEETNFPQIIFSSNEKRLATWLKSRIKFIEFDVHFSDSSENRKILNDLMESQDNSIFRWFSYIYIELINDNKLFDKVFDDELYWGRLAFQRLYKYANRSIPDYFPNKPIEQIYDLGRDKWKDLIKLKKVKIYPIDNKKRLRVDFQEDIRHEIKTYASLLHSDVKYEIKGSSILIESPHVFDKWIDLDYRKYSSFKFGLFKFLKMG